MTRNVKWKITAIVLLLMAVTNGMAQASKEFLDATYDARKKIQLSNPVEERNELPLDPNLHHFVVSATSPIKPGKASTLAPGHVKVCALLKAGDYSKYYKNKVNVPTPSLWVFEPNDTKTKFANKVSIIKNQTWKRFCQFLGLDNTEITISKKPLAGVRDTIVYLEVPLDSLFRPAYTTDIRNKKFTPLQGKPIGENYYMLDSEDSKIKKWFADQQCHNTYPWTRLGYTYDWGDPTDHFGATEYILKPGIYKSHITKGKETYKILKDFLKQP